MLLLLATATSFAQKYELGKVTIEELKETVCPLDTSAVASILFSKGDVKFEYIQNGGFSMVTNVKTKIKIYKKEGYDWANKVVSYYIDSSPPEKLNFSNEVTYNLVNGKIEKTKLKSNGLFEEKVNKYWAKKKISMPNVKEGSIIEFEYTVVSKNFSGIDKWAFQSSIPVLYSEYNVSIPEYYAYTPVLRGFLSPKVTTDKKESRVTINEMSRSDSFYTSTSKSNVSTLTFNNSITNYVLENILPIKDEKYVNNIKNFVSSIELELATIKFPGQTAENFSTSWEAVVKRIYENDDFGAELNKTGYYEKDVDAITAGITSQEEKMNAILNFVKTKMNWNDFYGYRCDSGVKKAYQEKTGNVAEINLMLTSMLRYAGFEANPILISTRGNGIAISPSRTAFDYVIAGVELNSKTILLDATSKFSLPNIIPIRDLNWIGRLIRKDGTSNEIDLMPQFNSKDIINLMAEITEDGQVSGKLRDQYFDYNAFSYRENYNALTTETTIEKIEKKFQGIEVSEYDVANKTDLSKPVVESFSFSTSNEVELIGGKMYFSPLLFFALTENPFKQETRLYPLDFVYPSQDKYNITIKIPSGYTVETLPASKSVALPDNKGNFKYSISNTENQIQLMFTLDINDSIISSDIYEEVKMFFKEIVDIQTEKIVLKKI